MDIKNVVVFSDKNRIEEEAADWLIRMDGDGELSKDEMAKFTVWLNKNKLHRRAFEELAKTWNNANILTELAVQMEQPKISRRRVMSIFGSCAASIVLAVFAFNFVGTMSIDETNGEYSTKVGKRSVKKLADGSQVQLNTNTKLRVDFNHEYRDIYLLAGEAHFKIAKNQDVPLRVFAGSGRVRAVGTAFSVYLRDNEVDVIVEEGRVALEKILLSEIPVTIDVMREKNDSQRSQSDVTNLGFLRAGEAVTMLEKADESESDVFTTTLRPIENVVVSRRLAWTEGVLVFSGQSLEEVVNQLGRYTTESIEFKTEELKNIRIGGRFPTGDADIMLAALESNVGLTVTRIDNNRVVISDSSLN